MKYKIAILGPEDAILGFKALGVEPQAVLDAKDLILKLKEICNSGKYAVVFITEDFFKLAKEEIFELSKRALPAIIPIPSHKGSEGLGQEKIKRIVEQAVGSDILSNDK